MRTFTVVDTEHKPVAQGEEIGDNIFRVYHPDSELYKAIGGYALQTELFPSPIPTHQLSMFPEDETETQTPQTDPRQLNMFE